MHVHDCILYLNRILTVILCMTGSSCVRKLCPYWRLLLPDSKPLSGSLRPHLHCEVWSNIQRRQGAWCVHARLLHDIYFLACMHMHMYSIFDQALLCMYENYFLALSFSLLTPPLPPLPPSASPALSPPLPPPILLSPQHTCTVYVHVQCATCIWLSLSLFVLFLHFHSPDTLTLIAPFSHCRQDWLSVSTVLLFWSTLTQRTMPPLVFQSIPKGPAYPSMECRGGPCSLLMVTP